jgi:rubrerythrin
MATQGERQEQPTSKSSGKKASADSASNLKSREYRDAQGNVHHHTHSYQAEHSGTSSAEAKSSAPRGAKRGARKADSGKPVQAEDGSEAEDSEDEIEAQVSMLLGIAQMDSEAAVAYETAATFIEVPEVRDQLLAFAGDHRRHIDELGKAIESLGGEPATAAPPPESSVFTVLASAAGLVGTQAALLALIANEEFTNSTYETALDLLNEPEVRELVQRNLEDEQRHINWLTEQAGPVGDVAGET